MKIRAEPMPPSQYRAEMQRRINAYNAEVRQRVDAYNRAVNQVNQAHKSAVNDYNRAVDRHNTEVRRRNQALKSAINNYNSEVRSHNAAVSSQRQRIANELSRAQRIIAQPRYQTYSASVQSLNSAFQRVESAPPSGAWVGSALIERENANSLATHNALLEGVEDVDDGDSSTPLASVLSEISADLAQRWTGALFALNPKNPDAARHFCTSAREILSNLIDIRATDADVMVAVPNCPVTGQGKPTRRAKVRFALLRTGMQSETLEDFVEKDIENVLELFRVFNDATHGSAGTFGQGQLRTIKKRVEDAVMFMASIFD